MWRLRAVALVVGGLATLAIVVVGCTSVTSGTAHVNDAEAPAYRASVSASIEASESTSRVRESERQQSLTTQAIHTACEDLSSSSVDAITAVNTYVEAYNNGAGDVQAKTGPAIDALHHSADLVAGSVSDMLSPQLRDALNAWVDASRGVATAIAADYGARDFNAAVDKLNGAKDTALNICDAAYR